VFPAVPGYNSLILRVQKTRPSRYVIEISS
jgi:hypothetical protein